MQKFNPYVLYVILAAIALYLLAFQNPDRLYTSLALGGAMIYVYYMLQSQPEGYADARERYEAGRAKPGGRNRLPPWNRLTDLQVERYKDLIIYVFFYESQRWKVALQPDGNINKMVPPDVAPLAASDVRNLVMNEAYGREERGSLENAMKLVRDAGFRIIPIKFKEENV